MDTTYSGPNRFSIRDGANVLNQDSESEKEGKYSGGTNIQRKRSKLPATKNSSRKQHRPSHVGSPPAPPLTNRVSIRIRRRRRTALPRRPSSCLIGRDITRR